MVKKSETEKTLKNEKKSELEVKITENEFVGNNDRVGNLLLRERLKKGLELEDVSQTLCIRKVYLEAIENSNYVELPTMPYSVGFVNSYAKFLGMNNNRISQMFQEELDTKPNEKNIFVMEEPVMEASLPDKRYILGGGVALVALALIWSFATGSEVKEIENQPIAEQTTEEEIGKIEYFSPSAEEQKTMEVKEVPSENQSSEQVVITEESFVDETAVKTHLNEFEIKILKEDTWVGIKDQDKHVFNKTLHPGESYKLDNATGMVLSVGKYEGVEVYINGKLTPVISPKKKTNIPLDQFFESAEH